MTNNNRYFLMKCGHVANTEDPYGNPVCIICAGANNKADIIEKECHGNIGLENRYAKCNECGKTRKSNWELAFFKYCPEEDYDEFYDGCYGWN